MLEPIVAVGALIGFFFLAIVAGTMLEDLRHLHHRAQHVPGITRANAAGHAAVVRQRVLQIEPHPSSF